MGRKSAKERQRDLEYPIQKRIKNLERCGGEMADAGRLSASDS